ncbi:MAG: FGGY family carbohydrate kinase [Bryobacteraceae bacterium]
MRPDILALDVGTTAFKLAVFSPGLEKKCEAARPCEVRVYDGGKADIEPETWWQALRECCAEVRKELGQVGVISLSVTTPGLTPMAADGTALGPAILFFDGRSHRQARDIRTRVGDEKFLRETCNLPVTGGSSLCSILWIRDHQPDVWAATEKFGHTNTYLVKRLTGNWAIDPSTVSITGLYNTAANDLSWNAEVLRLAGIPESKLPPVMHSHQAVGRISPAVAGELGVPPEATVLCGGNDAVLAAFSGGLREPGTISNVCGTCEITAVCVDSPVRSPNFNLRCHVVPGRWFTFFVLNTGGKALEWFQSVFCKEMTEEHFYGQYIPSVLAGFFAGGDPDRREAALPEYVPFLGGSRYSADPLKASFSRVSLETTREDLLLGLIRGNALYHGAHLAEVGSMVKLGRKVRTTGGGARIPGYIAAKKRWTGDFDYEYQDQSSLLGAAMLACNLD